MLGAADDRMVLYMSSTNFELHRTWQLMLRLEESTNRKNSQALADSLARSSGARDLTDLTEVEAIREVAVA